MLNTQKRVQARLLHLQTNTLIDLPPNISVIRIGKANSKWLPDIDVSKLPNSTVVSSLHAEIRVQGNSYFIEDLASDFGTYLNQSRLTALTRYELHWGDRIDLGENKQFTLIFQGKRPFFNFSFSRQRQVSVTAIQPKAGNSKQTSATNKPIKKGIVTNDTAKLQRGRFGVKRLFWYLFLIGTGYVAAFWVNNFNDTRSRQSSLTEQQAPLIEPSQEPAISDTPRGETIYVDDLSITVVEVKSLGKKLSKNQFVNFEPLGTWQMVVVDVSNTGSSTESLPLPRLALKDASGNTYDISPQGTEAYSFISGNKSPITVELPPSISGRFHLLFDVTPRAKGFQFIVKGEESLY